MRFAISQRMRTGPAQLLIDSFAIGIVAATILLEAVILLNLWDTGRSLASLAPFALAVVWFHLAVLATPFGTLYLLARDAE
jgi:hypothetical protein